MTIEQAVAILEAERVLQTVGAGGPEIDVGTPWHGYVAEAVRIIDTTPHKALDRFKDLHLAQDCRELN